MDTIRTQSIIYYDTNGNYGSATTGVTTAVPAGCTNTGSMFYIDSNIKAAITAASSSSPGNVSCGFAAGSGGVTAWAVHTPINTGSSQEWCVDSTGVSKQETIPGTLGTAC